MSKKTMNTEGLGLSLTGSQFGSRPNSSRSTSRSTSQDTKSKSNKKNVSSGASSGKSDRQTPKRSGSTGNLSVRSDVSSIHLTGRSAAQKSGRDEFLDFFDTHNKQPKIMKPKQQQKTKPAWATTPNSARSTSTMNSQGDAASASRSNISKGFSHSVFEPTSARSDSTLGDDDYNFNVASHHANSTRKTSVEKFSNNDINRDMFRGSDSNRDMYRGNDSSRDMYRGNDSNKLNLSLTLKEDMNRSRNSLHGENDMLCSQYDDRGIEKTTKLNSIANNMTSQALSPGTKAPILGMENSYQNIKHKTPVNQVNQSAKVAAAKRSQHTMAEDYIKTCNMAATRIQRWWKRHCQRNKAGAAAMKRLLDAKRQSYQEEMRKSQAISSTTEEDRKKIREEKARKARQQAIEDLQRKRQEKREETEKVIAEEMRYLEASGKVRKTPAHKSNVKKKASGKGEKKENIKDQRDNRAEGNESSRLPTDRKIEDIFHNNNTSGPGEITTQSATQSESSSPREAESDSPHAPSQAKTQTTIDDLMLTLQKLEEDEKFPTSRHDKNKKPIAWLDELEQPEKDDNRQKPADNVNHFLSDEKLRNIISYLDEVDTAERLSEIDQDIQKANAALLRPALLVPSGEELAQLEQASASAAEVTHSMMTQKMELEEKKRTVSMLQKALNQQRELTVRHAKETEKEMKKRLDVQKDEYEETIKRHLSFIDQLIDDKKALGEKCEQLVKELKQVDKKYQEKIKTLTDNHDVEMSKVKDIHVAAEKLRREKWIDEKTKKIKEMTVKGLEPEIQRLIAKHKSEIKKLKSVHEAELLASDERAGGRYIKMTEELRDQLAQEKEMACARERELARKTYEKQMQQEEEAYQQQRRRLYTEVQEEKERLSSQMSRQKTELDKLQRQLHDSHGAAVDAMRKEYETAREEQEKRHETEISQMKERLTVEKSAWEENYKKKQETWLIQKERELKEAVRRERDKEIELVISRLEEDNQGSREECERVAENRIKRLRDKYESEISELERSERMMTEKYNQTKAQLAEYEGETERLKVTMKQKEKEVGDIKKLLDRLNEERDRVSDVIRQEFADRIVATEEENKRLKTSMSELKARQKVELEKAKDEIDEVNKNKEREMEEVHKRVKQAILKKEEVVTQLKDQYQAAVKRADHIEGLLEQQRKQLLKK